jgi:hypothetical protein
MEASATWLRLTLDAGRDLPMEEFDELVRDLQDELLVLDVLDVELASAGTSPPRSKAGDATTGTLLVGLVSSGALLGAIASLVQSWLARTGQRGVKLELDGDALEVTGISSRQQQELIGIWIERHGNGGKGQA